MQEEAPPKINVPVCLGGGLWEEGLINNKQKLKRTAFFKKRKKKNYNQRTPVHRILLFCGFLSSVASRITIFNFLRVCVGYLKCEVLRKPVTDCDISTRKSRLLKTDVSNSLHSILVPTTSHVAQCSESNPGRYMSISLPEAKR